MTLELMVFIRRICSHCDEGRFWICTWNYVKVSCFKVYGLTAASGWREALGRGARMSSLKELQIITF